MALTEAEALNKIFSNSNLLEFGIAVFESKVKI